MGLIRLLILLLLIWLGWRLYRAISQQRKSTAAPTDEHTANETMVRCDYCRLHLPRAEALRYQTLWFCSDDHKARYLRGENPAPSDRHTESKSDDQEPH